MPLIVIDWSREGLGLRPEWHLLKPNAGWVNVFA
jgi:hypothetical protein